MSCKCHRLITTVHLKSHINHVINPNTCTILVSLIHDVMVILAFLLKGTSKIQIFYNLMYIIKYGLPVPIII